MTNAHHNHLNAHTGVDLKWRTGKEAIHFFPATRTPKIESDPEISLREVIDSSVCPFRRTWDVF